MAAGKPAWLATLEAKHILLRAGLKERGLAARQDRQAREYAAALEALQPLGLPSNELQMLAGIEARGGYGVNDLLAAVTVLTTLTEARRTLGSLVQRGHLVQVDRPDGSWFVLPRFLDEFSTPHARRARDTARSRRSVAEPIPSERHRSGLLSRFGLRGRGGPSRSS